MILGLEDISHREVGVDLEIGNFVLVGPPRSGKSVALSQLAAAAHTARHTTFALLSGDSDMDTSSCKLTGRDPSGWMEVLARLDAALREAQLAGAPDRRVVLFADDVDRIDYKLYDVMRDVPSSRYLRIVGSSSRSFGSALTSALARELARARQGIALQPATGREVVDMLGLGRARGLRHGLLMPPGRGVFVVNGRASVVQVTWRGATNDSQP